MQNLLMEVAEGTMTFNQFARNTRPTWTGIADRLHRRWKMPPWLASEDIEQDLLLAAWLFIDKFNPARATNTVDLARFVRWNAIDKAKKSIHKARGADTHRGADRNPSRIERAVDLSLAEAGDDDAESRTAKRFAVALAVDGNQETDFFRAEATRVILRNCTTLQEHLAVQALVDADGDTIGAALMLYEDPGIRLDCRMNSTLHATHMVRDAVKAVSRREIQRSQPWYRAAADDLFQN